MSHTIEELIEIVKEYNNNEKDFNLIRKAYDIAKQAHADQKRASGTEFVTHPLAVAIILAEKRMDHETICAALLHDVVEDSGISLDEIRKHFDEDTAQIVEGVTKTEKVRYMTKDEYNAENLRKMLLATSKDARVMILKLADRLDNMKTLSSFKEYKQKRIAKETLDIYAPIAHKLGMWKMKGELEDLALRYLEPKVYADLKKQINEKRTQREKRTEEIVKEINNKIARLNIDSQVYGRAKYFYSIYKKMTTKSKSFNEINDLIAIRIIAKNVPDSYMILELIKRIFIPIEGRFKDYIKNPKRNGYQSLHLDVKTKDNVILEFQIRTQDMHLQAEEGVAAHWQYKQTERDKKFDRKIGWLKQILDWKSDAIGKEFLEEFKIDLFQGEIVILTPNSDPLILPEGSTPIDFAFAVHTNIGMTCSKAEVNGKLVPLDYRLKSGDVCRIITQKNAKPNRTWLNFVKTSKARQKIRSYLGIIIEKDQKSIRRLEEIRNIETNLIKYLDYTGKKNIKLSKCCNPQYNDQIIAFTTKDGSLTVHKTNCPNIHAFDINKSIEIKWKHEEKDLKTLIISVKDRIGLIYDILDASINNNIQTLSINIKTIKANLLITLKIKNTDNEKIKNLINEISKIDAVHSVTVE